MATATLEDDRVQSAIRRGVSALARMTDYVLPVALDRRLQQLSDRKEYLGEAEHEELLALVAFTQDRTLDKLQSELARRELAQFLPEEKQP